MLLEPLADIVVWCDEIDTDEPAYQGSAMDCPFHLSECYLCKGLNDEECALDVRGSSPTLPALIISVTADELEGVKIAVDKYKFS